MHVVLAGLAEDVIRTRVDLIHFPILFYFYAENSYSSLPQALLELRRFPVEGRQEDRHDLVRLAATTLSRGIDQLAKDVGQRLNTPPDTVEDVLAAFAELHHGGNKQ